MRVLSAEEVAVVSGGLRQVFWGFISNLIYDAARGIADMDHDASSFQSGEATLVSNTYGA
ncbi:hypothetical protein [Pseudoxanthomonas sp. z9]|uniref:hypothetical protein n=1 Tax=Pseudoxanthomonas sp. z9 TaxID=2584942 RepID=UPI0011435EBC|nr:hypothetical protein [Pseudoxanthomonas sp. z9]MCL6711522.1 hypothetical protein [Pseudomonas sp. R2.Fl]